MMTCGANVIENVKNAVENDNVFEKNCNNASNTFKSSLDDKKGLETESQSLSKSYR